MGPECCKSQLQPSTIGGSLDFETENKCEMNPSQITHTSKANSMVTQPVYVFLVNDPKEKGKPTRAKMGEEIRKNNTVPLYKPEGSIVVGLEKKKQRTIPLSYSENKMVSLQKEGTESPDSVRSFEIKKLLPNPGLKVNLSSFRRESAGNIEERYEIMESIGKGGYGVVKAIRSKTTGEKRAVKIIVKSKCEVATDYTDEIKILQQLVYVLNHDRIGSPKRSKTL